MQGKTHFVTGIAASLAICRPQSFPLLVAGTGVAAVGSVISDIDVGNSSAHHDADKIIAAIIAAIAAVVIADLYLHLGIYERLLSGSSQPKLLTLALIFLVICAFGKSTKHRSFMHSFAALLALSACLYLSVPVLTPYFAIAFLSHLALDFFNRKKERLFWPSKKGYGFGLCTSTGLLNKIFFFVGLVAAITLFMTSVPMRNTGLMITAWFETIRHTLQNTIQSLWQWIRTTIVHIL